MVHTLSKRSLLNLEGVHEDMKRVCWRACDLSEGYDIDFIVTDGHRTLAEQKVFVAQGKSRTMKSRHLQGMAVDVVALQHGRVTYDQAAMGMVATIFKRAAAELGINIIWGGDWTSFRDMPHFELDKRYYPDAV